MRRPSIVRAAMVAMAMVSATYAGEKLAVIRDGQFTGLVYAIDRPEYRAHHAQYGELCVWTALPVAAGDIPSAAVMLAATNRMAALRADPEVVAEEANVIDLLIAMRLLSAGSTSIPPAATEDSMKRAVRRQVTNARTRYEADPTDAKELIYARAIRYAEDLRQATDWLKAHGHPDLSQCRK